MPQPRIRILLLAVVLQTRAYGGDIPGLRAPLPPFIDSRFDVSLSNDFLGRGGSIDDYRTQQIIVGAELGKRSIVVLDHSVLTLTDAGSAGRVDQLSGSLGYRLLERHSERSSSKVHAGLGFRSVGDFAGERMQNGFHRLIGSDVEDLSYSDINETHLTAWVDAARYGHLQELRSEWHFGYWLLGRTLATTGGQWDSSVGIFGMAGKGRFNVWSGLRKDWRSGYQETVQRETARAEQDLALVLGLRFGALVLETVQQFENDASFGQLRLLSFEVDAPQQTGAEFRLGLELVLLLPDVHLQVAARLPSKLLTDASSAWRESIVLSAAAGEPQYGNDASLHVDATQIGVGIEWERRVFDASDWANAYGSLGAGWRREKLVGDLADAGQASSSADSGIFTVAAGLRFHASGLASRWRCRIQTGFVAWLPTSDAQRTVDRTTFPLLEPTVAWSLGVTFDVR